MLLVMAKCACVDGWRDHEIHCRGKYYVCMCVRNHRDAPLFADAAALASAAAPPGIVSLCSTGIPFQVYMFFFLLQHADTSPATDWRADGGGSARVGISH